MIRPPAPLALTLLLAVACDPTGSVKLGEDTNGVVPEECSFFSDADGDGYGDDATEVIGLCEEQPSGTALEGGDCDDAVAEINPAAEEVCDGVDNNCSGAIDDDATDASTWYTDSDGDGYGDDATAQVLCEQPSGTIELGGDCDDTDTAYNPAALEEDCADPNDYNCDGSTGYDDQDGDGWAACEECDDLDAAINPDATEICDGVDNECDGLIDDDDDSVDASTFSTFYADSDADGYGDVDATSESCAAGEGYVEDSSDCDDAIAEVNPGANEVCDDPRSGGVDNDCDGLIDDDDDSVDPATFSTWYGDADGDGYGAGTDTTDACLPPSGYGEGDLDCDDANPDVSPGATEACDGVDTDCDGVDDNGFSDTDGDALADCVDVCPVYADPTQSANGDGSETSPYMSINDAITLRGEYCDDILLLPGTYEEVVDYGGVDLNISSTDGAETTIIDASSVGGSVVTFANGESAAATLSGVTLTGGSGAAGDNARLDNLSDYRFYRNSDHGGGVYIYNADPTISDCIITGNTVDGYGGGVVAVEYDGTFSDNEVSENEAEYEQFGGGGIWLYNSDATVSGNLIQGNDASGSSGDGGGIHIINGSPTVVGNWILENTATNYGQGVRFYYNGGLFANNVIANHGDGDAVSVWEASSFYFINNTIDDNDDGLYIDGGSGDYYNNLITNSADDGLNASYNSCLVDNTFDYNDVWGSGDEDYNNGYCEYYLQRGSYSNTSEDPDYTDAGNGDWSLQSSSGVKDAGADTSGEGVTDDIEGTARPQGNAYSMGAYEL